MNDAVKKIVARAAGSDQRIVLPEAGDPRVLRAARSITDRRYARVVVLGEAGAVARRAHDAGVDLSGIELLDPLGDPRREEYIERLWERRKAKGMTRAQAERLLRDPVYHAGMMVGAGDADGMVAGSVCPTRETIRSALYGVGLAEDIRTVSAASIINTVVREAGVDGSLVFADTAVVPEPTVEQLADIAIAAAGVCRDLLEAEPRVAMLSFSTKGSAHSPAVQKVIDATQRVRSRRPDLKIDGELQLDAAVIPEVARTKAGDSDVAGRANTLIFPDLSSANIGSKLVDKLGQASALGPLLEGLARPVNDLSRSCHEEDIVLVTAITAIEAHAARRAG